MLCHEKSVVPAKRFPANKMAIELLSKQPVDGFGYNNFEIISHEEITMSTEDRQISVINYNSEEIIQRFGHDKGFLS
jgi:hypothetical protein